LHPNPKSESSKPSEPLKREITNLGDERLLPLIGELTDARPTYGYRRITALLRLKTSEKINPKRVYLLMRQKHQGLRINVLKSLTYILNYLVATDNEDGSGKDRVNNDSYPKQNWIFVFPNGPSAKINLPLFD